MSLAVFTDSTTAQASPLLIFRPTSGSSTKTMSVNSCCAWSVMPTVAVSPLRRTHSWDFVYFKSGGTLLINFGTFHHQDPKTQRRIFGRDFATFNKAEGEYRAEPRKGETTESVVPPGQHVAAIYFSA